jgi:uncharacterized protein YyaL (SSP411 family)
MAMNLQRLAILLGRDDLRGKAEQIIRAFGRSVGHTPIQHERLLCGIEAWHQGFEEIAIAGAPDDPGTKALLRAVYGLYLPNKVVARVDSTDRETLKRMPLLAGKRDIGGKPTAYVCRNFACQTPTTDPAALRAQLQKAAKSTAIAG